MNPSTSQLMLLILFSTLGCQASPPASTTIAQSPTAQADSSSLEKPALIEVNAERDSLLFIYRDKEQREHRVMSIKEIPEESRERVFVLDLKRSPSERGARRFVQVFDLRAPQPDGTYLGQVVTRDAVEHQLQEDQDEKRRERERERERKIKQANAAAGEVMNNAQQPARTNSQLKAGAPGAQPKITLYSTSWCGYCKKARAFLKARGLKFTELDIERDRAAARALARKSKRAGIELGGVPVIEVGDQLIGGFDPNKVLSAVQSASRRASP